MSDTILATDRQAIGMFKKLGVKAKSWRNTDDFAPPADVNYRGELRIHTGGQPVLVASDSDVPSGRVATDRRDVHWGRLPRGDGRDGELRVPLPKQVDSVDEAHQVLRPKGLLPHAKRQGEWFLRR